MLGRLIKHDDYDVRVTDEEHLAGDRSDGLRTGLLYRLLLTVNGQVLTVLS